MHEKFEDMKHFPCKRAFEIQIADSVFALDSTDS